ncbi:MAG: hypothetical protein OXL37_19155 [Chloroflexota bacterium]|nr:hypothetical protein [Chloroflexota bacterium]MDE2958703.1 hypothetical protein [Chloroflexota bacterium]
MGNGTPAETGYAPTSAATVWDLAEPDDLITPSQGNDTTAFREEDAGFSAHYQVAEHSQGNGQDDLRPRLNVMAITDALLADPDESNANRKKAGRHVDSGGNFGIVELPMAVTRNLGSAVPPRLVTVYYDDRGWVVAYLPADEPAAGIWRYDPQDQDRQVNDLEQNLLVLTINEVLSAARQNVPEIANADHGAVGYYHWEYPECNAFVLFSHESGGGTSEPVRFVVPPTIEHIMASATVLLTSLSTPGQTGVTADLMVDDSAVVSVEQPARLTVSGFELARTEDASRLYEVTVAVDAGATAAGAVMLVYTKPGS